MYMLKSAGDSTPPCGTQFLNNWRCVDVLFLNVVYVLRAWMYFTMNLKIMCGIFV